MSEQKDKRIGLDDWNSVVIENHALRAELEQAQQRLNTAVYVGAGDKVGFDLCVLDKIFELEQENERLREALEFYADATNYGALMPVPVDRGTKARAALAGDAQ